VSASALGKDFFNILASIEHTNDFGPIVIQTIEHDLQTGGERAQARPVSSRDRPARGKSSIVEATLSISRRSLSAVTRPAVAA